MSVREALVLLAVACAIAYSVISTLVSCTSVNSERVLHVLNTVNISA